MPDENVEEERLDETQDVAAGRPGIGSRLRGAVSVAGERVTGTTDTITGLQFRKQFEDFTEAVTTAVVGVHRDQAELRDRLNNLETPAKKDRLDNLETPAKSGGVSPLVVVFGIIAVLALALSIVAVMRSF